MLAFRFSGFSKDRDQQGLWECGKVEPLFGETFPSGGGNPRFLRISTDAAFPSGQTMLVLPTHFAEDPKRETSFSVI
jgi:hypothetical protein